MDQMTVDKRQLSRIKRRRAGAIRHGVVPTMNGTIITLPCGAGGIVRPIDGPPTLEYVQAAVDGADVEMVPGFETIEYAENIVDCFAFADQDAKAKGKLINRDATVLWDAALLHAGYPGLIKADGRIADMVWGQVAVVFGDAEFMDALSQLRASLGSSRN